MWLNTGKERDRHKFAAVRSAAWKAKRLAKEEWFIHKAEEADRGRHSIKVLWRCIRDIQQGRRGLAPVRSSVVKDEEGNVGASVKEQQERWRRHFLNIQSEFSVEQLEMAKQKPIRPEITVNQQRNYIIMQLAN